MDAETVADRIRLGLKAFNVLREMGLFGAGAGIAAAATEVFGIKDGEPVFARFPLLGEAGGYVDLALQPWLGDPVVAVVTNVRWDPAGFQDQADVLGYKWRRWVNYSEGEVALECEGVFLDFFRGSKEAPYRVRPHEVKPEWGLSPEQRADNERRYSAYVAALAASNGNGGLAGPRFTANPGSIDLCSSTVVSGGSNHCIPENAQADDQWCVPAVLEMVIEYFLPPTKGGAGIYQHKLARCLGLYGVSMKDWPKIPQAVSDVSSQAVLAELIGIDWGSVVNEIDAKRPLAYLQSDHAFLVFGYSGVVAWLAVPAIAYLEVLDPFTLGVGSLSLSSIPSGSSLVRFWQGGSVMQELAMKVILWLRHFGHART
jgi:hypothetical protein